jgi:hypothetical protein
MGGSHVDPGLRRRVRTRARRRCEYCGFPDARASAISAATAYSTIAIEQDNVTH